MSKVSLIIRREYLSRVRKKSFIIMTFFGPLLMAGLGIVPVWLASASEKVRTVYVLDETGITDYQLKDNSTIRFAYIRDSLPKAKQKLKKNGGYALLHIPKFQDDNLLNNQRNIKLFSYGQISLNVKIYIENQVEKEIEREMLRSSGVDHGLVSSIENQIKVNIASVAIGDEKSKDKSADVEVSTALAAFSGILIYFFIFLFGAQVMRGVIEEKTSRFDDGIISSVKHFQLMRGKIIGIAFVGLTQFLLWVVLTAGIYSIFMNTVVKDKYSATNIESLMQKSPDGTAVEDMDKVINVQRAIDRIGNINWMLMIPCFIFYFLGGYLLYGALFAAIGGAVDNESDTQQFVLPITAPLIFAFIMAQTIINDPSGEVAKWLSIIPFTSPIIMMVRLPFGVHYSELLLSMGALIVGFIFTTWLAGKIYRTGILMYGKKATWKEIIRWLRY
jgi:ABC-2 type transport system permease protein